MISYNFDGDDIVIKAAYNSAKTRALLRRPRASLCVMDGPKVVVVRGEARIASRDEAQAITERRLPPSGRAASSRQVFGERIVIVLTPTKVVTNQVEDWSPGDRAQ